MKAKRAHRHARPAVRPRLHCVSVEDVAVQALTKHQVAQRLQRIGIVQPASGLRRRRERFRANDGFAIDMRNGRGQLDGRISPATGPKFAHDDIRRRTALH